MKKFLSVLLVILSATSFIVSFALIFMLSGRYPTASISETMYHTARFAWLAFVFMLIPLGCLAFGIGLKIKKNLVIGIVFSALLLIYGGLLSVPLTQFSTDAGYLGRLETEVGIAFPEDMTVITQDWTGQDSRITTGNSGCLLCRPREVQFPFELRRKAGDCSRVTAGPIDLI